MPVGLLSFDVLLCSVQLAFNTQMLDLGQLGFSCPVNWKQFSFVGLGLLISNNDYQVHIDDYMFNKDVLLMIIAQTANPSINP